MVILGLDCGSSSIKAAVLHGHRVQGKVARAVYKTSFDGVRAEISAQAVLKGLAQAVHQLGSAAKKVDVIALDVMSPSWVAMDRHGKPLTPIITHQDRRSIDQARRIEKIVGKQRHLKLAGNRPIPGGISSTTWAWFAANEPALMKRADLVGHLSTLLHRTLTGTRVVDPSNASFMGVYNTLTLKGWNSELCDAVGANPYLLPEVKEGNEVAGKITPEAARRFGLRAGTPMLVGVVDTSAAMLLIGAKTGQVLNVSGSTDVLALCTEHPKPSEHLLTRALGIGRRWVHASTLAAAGSAFNWMNREFFPDLQPNQFYKLMDQLAKKGNTSSVRCEPYLAGERTSLDQRTASFTGLTLATTREDMLAALVESLATASAARISALQATGTRMRHDVVLSGGSARGLAKVLHRDWPGHWRYRQIEEATLRGLATLVNG